MGQHGKVHNMKTVRVHLEFSIPKESGVSTLLVMLKQVLRPVLSDPSLKSLGIKLDRKSSNIEFSEVEPW